MASISEVSKKSFDYVVLGGGTCGLTLAARLSEDAKVSVLVLEHGAANLDQPIILLPGQLGHTFGNPQFDYAFKTTPQEHALGKSYIWNRGKGLGGSSHMNFMVWNKPQKEHVDAIEKLGNPGWNGTEYTKYSRISETFTPASAEQSQTYPYEFTPENRGSSGPVQVTAAHNVNTIDHIFQKTMVANGVRAIKDAYGGETNGAYMSASNIDRKTWTRSYAATAYYGQDVRSRSNLTVLTEATAARVLFADAVEGKDLVATGVEFLHGGESYQAFAKKEVVLSLGAINSPQILELSGIGRPDILAKIDVDVKVALPGVGENTQEHTLTGMSFELNPNDSHETYDNMRNPEYAAEAKRLHGELKGMHRFGISSFAYIPLQDVSPDAEAVIAKAEASVAALKASGKLPPGLAEQYDLQLTAMRNPDLPDLQLIGFPGFFTSASAPAEGKSYISMMMVNNLVLSRGSIHAVSKDPLAQPEIDPHYYEVDDDLENLVQHMKFIRRLAETEPFKSATVREADPGPAAQTDEDFRKYIKEQAGTCWHTIGSCSMLPREKNGVVSPELKVYGTSNLRVVDLSILPIHVAAHMQATAYVVAEKAADIIRGVVRD